MLTGMCIKVSEMAVVNVTVKRTATLIKIYQISEGMVQLISEPRILKASKPEIFSGGNIWLPLAGYI